MGLHFKEDTKGLKGGGGGGCGNNAKARGKGLVATMRRCDVMNKKMASRYIAVHLRFAQ